VSANLRQPPSSHGSVLYGALRVRDEANEEARGLWEHSAARWHCEVLLAEEKRWSGRVTLWALTDAASCELWVQSGGASSPHYSWRQGDMRRERQARMSGG
jgi:hypothetical protein